MRILDALLVGFCTAWIALRTWEEGWLDYAAPTLIQVAVLMVAVHWLSKWQSARRTSGSAS